MSHAEICPVCKGKGKINKNRSIIESELSFDPAKELKTCHGCGGLGWVAVRDEGLKNLSWADNLYPTIKGKGV